MKTRRFNGFALPTILIASIVMLTVLLVAVSSTAAVRSSLNAQYYNRLSQSAGDAGIAYAKACLAANGNVPLWSSAAPLKPNTDCTGTQIPGFVCPENSLDSRCSVLAIGGASIQVLVVAAGGGGGGWGGGGGGGGQQVYDSGINVQQQGYSIVIGKGGIGGGNGLAFWNNGIGWDGVDGDGSSFNNINAMGGKGGIAGGAGVSTGGASGSGVFTGGLGGGISIYEAGGGAGDSGNGVAGLGMLSGNGGIGTANFISGSSVTRSGGGGGGATTLGAAAGLGVDGGGNGGSVGVGSDGSVNTGGGGGGGYNAADGSGWGGRGGSGVVIVSYSTGSITATGGNVTVNGSNTIHTFTDDGVFTVNSLGGNGVISTFSVGLPILGADGKAVDINSVGTTKLLRTSDNSTWRVYTQTSFYHKSLMGVITPITAIAPITGTTTVGSVLTAGVLTPSGATADYQWQSSTTAIGTYTSIPGAIANTYTLTSGDWGKYIKVVATGTGSYSGVQTSTDTGVITDPANWLAIGTQVWAKANLNVGTMVTGATAQTNNSPTPIIEKYCYGDIEQNCTDNNNGGLYQWDEAMQYVTTEGAQGICPTGSHIPSDNDWKILEMQLGMTQLQADVANDWRGTDQGTQLKFGGTSGLSMPLAGSRGIYGSFVDLSSYADLWSSSGSGASAWEHSLYSGGATVGRFTSVKALSFSVRCLGN